MIPPRPVECTAVVTAARALTPDISELTVGLRTPEQIRFKAGQFVNLSIPRGEAKPLIRAYSIASPAGEARALTFLFDTDVDGPGVQYLRGLKPGNEVRFKAPLGIFVLREPSDRPVLIVTHISALGMCRFLAEAALAESASRPVTLIAAVKDEDHLLYHRELLELSRRAPAFRHIITAPGGSASWTGPRRTLQEEMLRRIPASREVDIYICGLGVMVTELRSAARDAGVAQNRIVVEKWSKVESGAESAAGE